ncbi:hypothetical protein [Telluribacter humicola]|uniref:hypothetical protein n=1 Tax=Telluribacter humicola TaxID=1720261 RepID=UPI001A977E93|nr:hypothetical protein [Telluribacter humicola]
MNTDQSPPPVLLWAIVSMMGHQQIAGMLDEYQIGGQSFIRVTVPETSKQPSFTRLLTSNAVYSIDFCDEQTARWKAENLDAAPIASWDANQMIRQNLERTGQVIIKRSLLPETAQDTSTPSSSQSGEEDDDF